MRGVHHRRGFSIIEILLVTAIFTIIGTFSAVFFSRMLAQNAVANAQNTIVSQMRKAQIYAMAGKGNSSWGVRFGSGTLTLFRGSSYAARVSAFDENSTIEPSVTVGGLSEVVFTRATGLPSATTTITLSNTSATRTITTNSQGVVSR